MERIVYLDTHVVAWLYAGTLDLFPSEVRRILEEDALLISPIVLLELQYLREIGRLKTAPDKIMSELQKAVGLNLCRQEFSQVVQEALAQDWTRDPFDRIIVAQARVAQAPLVTKDAAILKHYKKTIW